MIPLMLFRQFKMRTKPIALCLIFGSIFIASTPIQAEELHCPSKCHCSAGFVAVKCPGLEEFPVFDFAASVRSLDLSRGFITYINRDSLKAYQNLRRLDIRKNEIKSVSPGLFSEMENLRELLIDDNPWSCDLSTLQVLQMELLALIEKNSPLDNFDGGGIRCADPPHMKGKNPLLLINSTRTIRVSHVHKKEEKIKSRKDSPGGWIALAIFLVVLLLAIICRMAWPLRSKIQDWITKIWKTKTKYNQVDMMESGKIDNRKTLIDSMKKRRRMSKGKPANDSSSTSSDDDDGKVFVSKEHHKDKMRKQRRRSRGFAKGDGSSDGGHSSEGESGLTGIDATDYLREKMKKQRRQSQGFAKGDSSSEGEGSAVATRVDSIQYLKEKMRKQRRQSCGIAEGECSSGEESGFVTIDLGLK